MAEIQALNIIAGDIRNLLGVYTPVNKNPKAKKRGNLKDKVLSYNTIQRIKGNPKGNTLNTKYNRIISVNYAPPGATYGKFVEKGTSKMKANPFASKAIKEATKKNLVLMKKELAKLLKKDFIEILKSN
jgi:HK97 gp10 family phage protein